MTLARARAQVRTGSGDGYAVHRSTGLGSNVAECPDFRFCDTLTGRALRVQSASSAMPSSTQQLSHIGPGGLKAGKKLSVMDSLQGLQRPHTACAPAVERHLRRYTRSMSAGTSVLHQADPDAYTCTERATAGRVASVSAAGELAVRPGTPVPGIAAPLSVCQWHRQVSGSAADTVQRRPGRSRSTDPSLLTKQSGDPCSKASLTAAKAGARTRIKAPVDCWWDEHRLGSSSGHKHAGSKPSTSSPGGARRNSPRRSSSAGGRRKSRPSSGCDSKEKSAGTSCTKLRSSSLSSHSRTSGSVRLDKSSSLIVGNAQGDMDNTYASATTPASPAPPGKLAGLHTGANLIEHRSSGSNSLMLISKLALPGNGSTAVLGRSLSAGNDSIAGASLSAETSDGSDVGAKASGTCAAFADSLVGSDVCTAEVAIGTAKLARSHGKSPRWSDKTGLRDHGAVDGGYSDDVQSESIAILPLQHGVHRLSEDLGMTGWFEGFCETLIDEFESEWMVGSDSDVEHT
jgi:hypothetical protein